MPGNTPREIKPFELHRRNVYLVSSSVLLIVILMSGKPSYGQQLDNNIAALKELSLEDLMNIEVISVSKQPEKLNEAASAIQVITQDDIRQSGATSVPEVLRLATNLQVAQVNSSQWAISARGFNNVLANKLLVLIDGRVVYTPLYAGVFWDIQNLVLNDIERIEVISGPGGTLWGANAMNGVINIITKNAKNTQGVFAEAAVGTELRGLGSLRYGAKIRENLSYRVYGTGFRRDNTMFRDSIGAQDDWQIAQGGLRLDWDATESDAVSFQANHYNGRPDPDGGMKVEASGTNLLARWNRRTSSVSEIQLQVFFDQTWRDFRNGFAEKLRTYDFEGQHRLRVGDRNHFIYGFGFRAMDHDVTNLELFAFLPARKWLKLYNGFFQDEFALVEDKLDLTIGIKIEHNSYTGFQYQPNARLSWNLVPGQILWSAVSRAVRNPARIDREFNLLIAPGLPFITGSDFQSEEVTAYELGWRFQHGESLSVSAASFYNEYDNIRSVQPGPPPFGIPVTFANGVEGNTYGFEFSGTYHPLQWWRLRGGYTFLKKDLAVKSGSTDSNEASAESNDPNHQFLIQSSIHLPANVEFGTIFRYVDGLPKPYLPEYFSLDIRIGWRVHRKIELNLVAQNLLEAGHTEFVPESPLPKDIERGIYGKIVWGM